MSKSESVIPIKAAGPWTAEQYATLNALLDLMIPASNDGRMPAASTLGLFDDACGFTKDARAKADHAALVAGLDEIDAVAKGQFGEALANLSVAEAQGLVDGRRVSSAPFFDLLTQHTVSRYYEHARVLTALGVEPTAPWPRGHLVEDGDWSLLDQIRGQAALYRQVD